MADFVAGSLNPAFSFALRSNTIHFRLPLGSTVAFTASVCLHP